MENQQSPNTNFDPRRGDPHRFRTGRTFGGLVIVVVGTLLLTRDVGVYFPSWLFSWPMFLIVLGFYIGIRHHFRNPAFLIPMAIGTAFLVDRMVPGIELRQYLWPIPAVERRVNPNITQNAGY